jgi:hypothetical protein
MITPLLERLILNGKASFNTFVAGGGEKCILNVPNDHFIIITSIQYSSALKTSGIVLAEEDFIPLFTEKYNTQLKIFSRKSLNTFLFRDSLNISELTGVESRNTLLATPTGYQKIDTYLVHESEVSFTFSYAGALDNFVVAQSKTDTIAYPPPADYGKSGQLGALGVRLVSEVTFSSSGNDLQAQGGQASVTGSAAISKECIFPVDANSQYLELKNPFSYPIVNVNYVLIQGLPNNISST